MAALLGGCSLLPTPAAPAPEVTAVRVEEQPVVYMPEEGVVRGPRPTDTAVWDEQEKAWTDTATTLVIELEPKDDVAGYTIAQAGLPHRDRPPRPDGGGG